MRKPFPIGIVMIILITLISMFCIFYLPLTKYPINVISYLLLGLFLPGYAFITATYPRKSDLILFKRIFGSIMISALLALILSLISYYQIVGISFSSAFFLIGILTILLSIDALEGIRRISINNDPKIKENLEIYNIHHSIKDIYIIIFLTLLSLTILSIPTKYITNHFIFNLKPVLSYLLIFVLSGYAFWAALIPRREIKSKRLILSLIFGIILFSVSYFILKFSLLEGPSLIYTSILSIFIGLMSITTIFKRINTPKIEKHSLGKKYEVEKKELGFEKIEFKSVFTEELIEDVKGSEIITNEQGSSKIPTNKSVLPKNSKKRFKSLDLFLIIIATLISLLSILNLISSNTVIRPVLGILLILFLPGYAIVSVIFPKKDYINSIERLGLSFAFPLIGLSVIIFISNFTNIVISLKTLTITIATFTLIMVLIGYIRRMRVTDEDRFYVNFCGFLITIINKYKRESKNRKIITIISIIVIILVISSAVYIFYKPNHIGKTDFNLLSPGGNASVYPTNLTVGQNGSVILEIVNNEFKTVNYQMVVTSNGTFISQENLTLTNGERNNINYTFTAGSAGYKKIEFLLYKLPDNTTVYKSQEIYVNMI
jgi:uncharacterized membrane protein